jgi:hypothetical protein
MVSLSKFVFKFTITNVLLFTERSGLQDIIHSVSLEQDIIEASILQLNKKKKKANQESEWKTCMKDKEDGIPREMLSVVSIEPTDCRCSNGISAIAPTVCRCSKAVIVIVPTDPNSAVPNVFLCEINNNE